MAMDYPADVGHLTYRPVQSDGIEGKSKLIESCDRHSRNETDGDVPAMRVFGDADKLQCVDAGLNVGAVYCVVKDQPILPRGETLRRWSSQVILITRKCGEEILRSGAHKFITCFISTMRRVNGTLKGRIGVKI
jgi:hypothetical protein